MKAAIKLPHSSCGLLLRGAASVKREGNKGPSSSALHGCAKIPKVTSLKGFFFWLMATGALVLVSGSLAWTCGEVDGQHGGERMTEQSSSNHSSREAKRGGGKELCLNSSVKCAFPVTQLPSNDLYHLESPLPLNNAVPSTREV